MTNNIPRQYKNNITTQKLPKGKIDEFGTKKIVFSFEAVNKNEYFNLDGTCQNWASDLFDTLTVTSGLTFDQIHSGDFSGRNTTLRIHRHENAKPPCDIPLNINLEDLWQIRISKAKGGVHGFFVENIFYIIWFDPQHNLYPDKKFGGLKKITPPSTCCKERDKEIIELKEQIANLQGDVDFWENVAKEYENKLQH